MIWRAFDISCHLIIVNVSRAVFSILMVHLSPRTNPYIYVNFSKVGIVQFFRNCIYVLTRNQGKRFEDMFLNKIESQEASLNPSTHLRLDLETPMIYSGFVSNMTAGKLMEKTAQTANVLS